MLVLWVCICRSSNFIVMWYISYFIQSNIQLLGYLNFASHLFSMVVVMCFFVLSACRLLLILFKLLTKNIQRYSTVLNLRGMFWQNKKYCDSLDNRLPQIHNLSSTGTYVDGSLWYYLFLLHRSVSVAEFDQLSFEMCMYFQYLSFTQTSPTE